MTYEKRYRIAGMPRGANNLTLYEARKELRRAREHGKLPDAAHIRRGSRAVGYYSEWHHAVRPMFQALDPERECLLAWGGA
jgi:hypothetical protein